MSETSETPTTTLEQRQPDNWRKYAAMVGFLLLLALIGVALEDYTPHGVGWYWIVVLPLFGLVCVHMSPTGKRRDGKLWPSIRQQIVHWLGFLLGLKLMFIMIYTGDLSRNASGLVSLLLLAMASYYAGVHLSAPFFVVAIVLAGALLGATYLEEYTWLILIVLALSVVVLFISRRATRSNLNRAP